MKELKQFVKEGLFDTDITNKVSKSLNSKIRYGVLTGNYKPLTLDTDGLFDRSLITAIKVNDEIVKIPEKTIDIYQRRARINYVDIYLNIPQNHDKIELTLMFEKGCDSIEYVDFSDFDGKNIKTLSYLFDGFKNLKYVKFGNAFKDAKIDNVSGMFLGCKKLETIEDLEKVNFSQATECRRMFEGCESIIELDLSNIDFKNVTVASSMFKECKKLEKLNLTNIKFDSLYNAGYLFYYCKSLKEIIGLETIKFGQYLDNIYDMFSNCSSLKNVNLSSFKLDHTNMGNLFEKCKSLTEFDFGKISYDSFYNCIMKKPFIGCNKNRKFKAEDPDLLNYLNLL